MSKSISVQENGLTVNIVLPDDVPRISADGFGPSLFGFPTTTLSLYQTQIGDTGSPTVQDRKVVATFTVPTITILELARNIQKTMVENKQAVDVAFDAMRQVLEKKI